MKKLIAIMLALICVVGVFAGCNNNQGDPQTPGDPNKTTITIGLPVVTNVEDYNTNALTLWIEEQTGYNLEFQMYASSPADYKTQLSAQMLDPSVTLPDMLIQMQDMGTSTWQVYGEDGYFVDLTDYMMDKEGKAKEWWDAATSVFDDQHLKNVIERCKGDDGRIYAYPSLERGMVDSLPFIAHINTAWLEQVGMSAPTNTEELYNVLKAFKQQCCKDGTYHPLLSGGSSVLGSDCLWWIIAMFVDGYDVDRWFRLSADGKTVEAPFTTPEYREALIYIRRLIDEQLLTDAIFSIQRQEYSSILNSADGAKCGVIVFHCTPAFNEIGNQNLYAYEPLDLYGWCGRAEYSNVRAAWITEEAEQNGKVDACWDILMLLCTKEGSIRLRYGDEGTNWTWCEDTTKKSYMGFECWINLVDDPFSRPNNEMWGTPTPTVNPQSEGEFVNLEESSEWMQYRYYLNGEGHKNFVKREETVKYRYPVIVMTSEEDDATKNERQNTQNAVESYRTKFLKGVEGLNPSNDQHWQKYLDELNKLGLQTWLNQYQGIYEARYMADVLAAGANK